MKKYPSGMKPGYLITVFLSAAIILLFGSVTRAQDPTSQTKEQVATAGSPEKTATTNRVDGKIQPAYRDYRTVQLGMNQDKVRQILGKPKNKSDGQDLFALSDDEMAQVFYNSEGSAYAISTTYKGDLTNAPTAMSVIGEDPQARDDGSIYRMIRYPEFGYWVSYSRTAGENRTITITMQKM